MTKKELYSIIPLDRETADKFISNCLKDGKFSTFESICFAIHDHEFKDVLDIAFFWDESPEGDDFWRSIHDSI